jgi:hypothetical protein
VEQDTPLPNIALLQGTPSSTVINPSASPTSLAINENVFEVGPIRDLLVEINREFAKGRNWGLNPALIHEAGVVTYSLLLYEKCDIAETGNSHLLKIIQWEMLVCTALGVFAPKFILDSIAEYILHCAFTNESILHIAKSILSFVEFILHLAFTSESIESIVESILYPILEPIAESIFEPMEFITNAIHGPIVEPLLLTELLLLTESLHFVQYVVNILAIYSISPFLGIFCLICFVIFGDLITKARSILVFLKSNKFWTHGHLKLKLNDYVYDYTWAAIGTKEFRALKLEIRATESSNIPRVNESQKGVLRFALASLPMEFRSSGVQRRGL